MWTVDAAAMPPPWLATSCIMIAASVTPSPAPPYSSGMVMPSQPASAIARWNSRGNFAVLIAELVRGLVSKSEIPLVLDADGLNAFEGKTGELTGKGRILVITPHPGEMARLAGSSIADVQKDRLGVARQFAREHELIVVLKGHRTLVVQPDGEAWVNTTGDRWEYETGGTGDILTGMVAGMMGQNGVCTDPEDAMMAVCAAGPPARAGGRRDARERRRTFDGRDGFAAWIAGGVRASAGNGAGEAGEVGRGAPGLKPHKF